MRTLIFLIFAATFFCPPANTESKNIDRLLSEIKSYDSDNYSDLHFLKKSLQGKRMVLLGESSHGAAEFYRMKVRIVKFLVQEMGFEVVAFESGMFECWRANSILDQKSPEYLTKKCMIWELFANQEMVSLFSFAKIRRKKNLPIVLAGFDSETVGLSSQTTRFEFSDRPQK